MQTGGSAARAMALGGLLLGVSGCAGPVTLEESWQAFGEPVRVEVRVASEADGRATLEDMRQAVVAVEADFDPRRVTGELARLNRTAGEGYHALENRDLYRCILLALDYARASKGKLDPSVGALNRLYDTKAAAGSSPSDVEVELALGRTGWDAVTVAREARAIHFLRPGMSLDLGAMGRAFALDAAARAFARPGSRGGRIAIGPHRYAWGRPPEGQRWEVSVPDPRFDGRELLRVRMTHRAVSVAAHPPTGRSPFGIIDPTTGRPAASDVLVAVALADSGADAAAVATALFVAGTLRGSALLEQTRRVETILLVRDERVGESLLVSASLRGSFEPSAELAAAVGDRVRFLLPPAEL